jgi:hypothetical protein
MRPVAWWARGAAATRGAGSRGALAWSGQRDRNNAGSARYRATRGQKTPGLSETDWVGTVALGRAQFGAQCCFAIIQTLLTFQNSK